jgi:hypothetical protein
MKFLIRTQKCNAENAIQFELTFPNSFIRCIQVRTYKSGYRCTFSERNQASADAVLYFPGIQMRFHARLFFEETETQDFYI